MKYIVIVITVITLPHTSRIRSATCVAKFYIIYAHSLQQEEQKEGQRAGWWMDGGAGIKSAVGTNTTTRQTDVLSFVIPSSVIIITFSPYSLTPKMSNLFPVNLSRLTD